MEPNKDEILEDSDSEQRLTFTVDQAYTYVGGHGCYQILVALSIAVTQISCMAYLFAIPLMQIFPVVKGCLTPTGICENKKDACNAPTRWYVDRHFNFITEFDLLCDDLSASLIASAFPMGFLAGCLIFSSMGDILGRIPSAVIGQSGMILSVLVLVAFPTYNVCLICTTICGFFSVASLYSGYTYGYDSNHSKYVPYYATYVGVVFAIGGCIVAGVMWTGIRWRRMCEIFMGFCALYAVFPLFLQEAPRFFYTKGNVTAAIKAFKYIAKINGKEIDKNFTLLDESRVSIQADSACDKIKLFFTDWVIIRVLLASLLFFTCGFIYYGLSLNVQKFGGNIYLNAMVIGFTEIVADISTCIIIRVKGLKYPLAGTFLITAVALVGQYIAGDNALLSSIALYLGKFGIAGSFTAIYVLAGKLFPTTISSTAIGLLGIVKGTGATLSPIAGNIKELLFIIAIGCSLGSTFVSFIVIKKTLQ